MYLFGATGNLGAYMFVLESQVGLNVTEETTLVGPRNLNLMFGMSIIFPLHLIVKLYGKPL